MKLRTCLAGYAATLAFFATTALAAPSVAMPKGPGEAEPVFAGAADRSGILIWDQGAPDLVDGQEATIALEAEEFTVFSDQTLTSARFWTIEAAGAFDGSFQWEIRTDGGGQPGAYLYGGATGLARAATGRVHAPTGYDEFENVFYFPPNTDLTPGTYYLVIHMSADCGTRDEVYWETGAIASGNTSRYSFFCADPWNTEGWHLAFQLFGKPTCPPPPTPNNPLPQNGSVDVPFNTVLRWNSPCFISNPQNPGFEAGNFSGWTANTFIPPEGSELVPWAVLSGGGYFLNGYPFEGSYFADNGFDGSAGLTYDLYQDFFIPPVPTAVLTWRDRFQWDGLGIPSTLPRNYRVSIEPAGGGAPLATLYSFDIFLNGSGYSDTGYVTHAVDLAALGLTGQALRLHFSQYVPESYTGPAQFDLDAIELTCEFPSAPPPSVSAARRATSDKAFALKAAMYHAVKDGEFRAPAEAMASGRFNPPVSELSLAKTAQGKSQPLDVAAERGMGALLFDAGAPNLANGWEQTIAIEADDFDAPSDSFIHFVRFWTFESGSTWDGTCEVSFYNDAGGTPGTAYYTSPAALVSRAATGRSAFGYLEYEYVVSLPGAYVPEGRNWINIHMSNDCATSENVYWETTDGAFGATGQHSQSGCTAPWESTGGNFAFQLYGEDAECPVTYDVYIRRLPYEYFHAICYDATQPVCDPGPLACESDYEWVVVAKSAGGYSYGPYWTFRTTRCCCPGDANGDRVVTFADITKVLENWLSVCP